MTSDTAFSLPISFSNTSYFLLSALEETRGYVCGYIVSASQIKINGWVYGDSWGGVSYKASWVAIGY